MTFGFLEGPDLLIVLAIILVLFGGAKLPELARSLGKAQKEFQKGARGDDDEADPGADSDPD